MSTAIARLEAQLRQGRPFQTTAQAAVIGLLLTADRVKRHMEQAIVDHADLTLQQFNVLRILRGAGTDGLPTLEVADRLLEPSPGMTRMMDRLEKKGLIYRERSTTDRRQVRCCISQAGLAVINDLDGVVSATEQTIAGSLSPSQVNSLLETLEACRTH